MLRTTVLAFATLFSCAANAATTEQISALRTTVEEACKAPAQQGSEWSVDATAEGNASVALKRLPSAGANGKLVFSRAEWEGVQRVLRTQQLDENKDHRQCVRDLYKLFLDKLSSAGNQVNKYVFVSHGVDDQLSCSLNGDLIASQVFGTGEFRRDVTEHIKIGQCNRLFCRVIDNNSGTCYAWDFELTRNGVQSVVKQRFGCCNELCRKAGGEVMNESFYFDD